MFGFRSVMFFFKILCNVIILAFVVFIVKDVVEVPSENDDNDDSE
ncbi:unknown [Firmicutes bacterium CAG:882]|nr:unknown [Firmicutes bacterium CAG:882]